MIVQRSLVVELRLTPVFYDHNIYDNNHMWLSSHDGRDRAWLHTLTDDPRGGWRLR
jgi:hypothetical protein